MNDFFKRIKKKQLPEYLDKEIGTGLQVGDKVVSCMTGTTYIVVNVTIVPRFKLKQVMQYDLIENCKRTLWHKPYKRTIYSYIKGYIKLGDNNNE